MPEYETERETGLEPATNGLEGRDSTIELPPHGPLYIAYRESQQQVIPFVSTL